MAPNGPTIGERIRQLRGGQTQMELATAAGVSVQLIRSLEQGRRHTPSISSLHKIARALDVDVAELVASTPRSLPAQPGEDAGVLAIRYALTSVDEFVNVAPDDGEPVTIGAAQRALTYAWGCYWSGRYDTLARVLPETLGRARAVHRQAGTTERARAAALAAGIYQVTACTLVHLHEPDAAHLALRQAMALADSSDDALLAATLRGSLSWVLLTQGRYQEAHRLAAAAAAAAEPVGEARPQELSVWGSLLLGAATAAGRAGDIDTARDLLGPAAVAAARIGHDRNDLETAFGPSQVVMQTADVHVVCDEYAEALAAARAMPRDTGLPLAARARHLADIALAHGQLRHWEAATDALLTAERAAPAWMRHQTLPRQVVRDLLARWHHPPLRLRELADRLGIV